MNKVANKKYALPETMTNHQILEKAAEIIAEQYVREEGAFSNPSATKEYLTFKLSAHEREVFAVMLLDNQHQLIEYKELFFGTINAASVHPREIVKAALKANAAAVILGHNHPSGTSEPSQSDKDVTQLIKSALALVDVRVIDHIVVGETASSFAEQGLL